MAWRRVRKATMTARWRHQGSDPCSRQFGRRSDVDEKATAMPLGEERRDLLRRQIEAQRRLLCFRGRWTHPRRCTAPAMKAKRRRRRQFEQVDHSGPIGQSIMRLRFRPVTRRVVARLVETGRRLGESVQRPQRIKLHQTGLLIAPAEPPRCEMTRQSARISSRRSIFSVCLKKTLSQSRAALPGLRTPIRCTGATRHVALSVA